MARTKIKVKQLIEKSKDSTLLAVEIYNKPRTAFRSSGFIVLMHIAWTSLFHYIGRGRHLGNELQMREQTLPQKNQKVQFSAETASRKIYFS